MRKIRVAQIGIGHDHGFLTLRSLLKQSDLFEVAAIGFPEGEQEKFRHLAKEYDGIPVKSVEEIMADASIEAVIAESEEWELTNIALAAARAGKHIHMDKPGGLELSTFEEMIGIMKEKQLVFHTGYMYRYNPEIIKLMESIKNGELGEIISVEAQMNCLHPVEKRQWLDHFPGGMLFFLGCHLIDLILQIQGKPNKIIPMNRCTNLDGVTAKDYGLVLLEYDHGISFAKSCANERGGFMRRQLVVTGTKKMVEIKPLEVVVPDTVSLLYTEKTEYTAESWHDHSAASRSGNFDRYDAMMASFAAMVRGEKQNPWSYDYELELYRTVLECCK